MKKVIVLLLGVVLLAGCGSDDDDHNKQEPHDTYRKSECITDEDCGPCKVCIGEVCRDEPDCVPCEDQEDCGVKEFCFNGECKCDPGMFRCNPEDPYIRQICTKEQKWDVLEDCLDKGKTCDEGACVSSDGGTHAECTPQEFRCADITLIEVCNSKGQWIPLKDCSVIGAFCDVGAPGPNCVVCPVGVRTCSPYNPNVVEECIREEDGPRWVPVKDCSELGEGMICVGGMCMQEEI